MRRRRTVATALAVLPVVLAACGTRVSRAEVIAGAGGGPVTLAPGTVAQGGAVTANGSDATGPAAVPAPSSTSEGTLPTTPATSGVGAGPSAGPDGGGGAVAPSGGATSTAPGPKTGPSGAKATAVATSAAPAPGQPCTKQGSPIVFGQVGTFSGIIGASIGAAQPALKVWAQATNAAGGIACHPVQVVSIDDAGDAGKAQSATQTLIQSDHAVAINAFVPVTLNGIQTAVDNARVPVVGGDLTADQWNTDPGFFPEGTNFESIIFAFMKYGAMQGGHKLSYLQCIEATPCSVAGKYIDKDAPAAGLQNVGTQPISLAGSNFTQQCATAKNKGADIIIIGAGATAVTAIGRDCANQGYHPRFMTIGLGATTSLQTDPNLDGMTIGLPDFPWMLSSTPAEAAYQAAIARYAPNVDTSEAGAQAWVSGELLKKAILNLGSAAYGDITPALVTQGLHLMKNETLGGMAPGNLVFPSGAAAPPDKCAFIASIANGKWGAPIGSQQICAS